MEFHGRWQTGQLLSRATTDLSTIRRFLGFGVLFLVINIVQLIAVTGAAAAACTGRSVWSSRRRPCRSWSAPSGSSAATSRISRAVQDQQGDLATVVEEGAVGIRVIKSFGRRRHVFDTFDEGACKVYDTSMEKVRLSSRFWTFLEVIPNVTLAIVLLLGALAVGQRRAHARAPWWRSSP